MSGEVHAFKALEVSLLCRHVVCVGGRLARHLQGLSSEAKGIKLQRLLLVNSSWSQEVRGCISPSLILPLLV